MSNDGNGKDPWAHICHRDGKWGGLIAADSPRKDLAKFLAGFIADGYEVMTVRSRAEYNAALAKMEMQESRPARSADLFETSESQ